jgi:SOS-response transcriptional repressor LexA
MKVGLTPRQAELLAFIKDYITRNGFPPSYAEMAEAVDVKAVSYVHRMVHALRDRGYIHLRPASARSVWPTSAHELTTIRALELVLSQCKLNDRTAADLQYLLKMQREANTF